MVGDGRNVEEVKQLWKYMFKMYYGVKVHDLKDPNVTIEDEAQ